MRFSQGHELLSVFRPVKDSVHCILIQQTYDEAKQELWVEGTDDEGGKER